MNYIYDQVVQDYGAVSFEAFINLLVNDPAFFLSASSGLN